MTGRDLVEWVSDQFLLMHIIDKASEIKRFHITRLHKILFLSELVSWKRNIGGLDYRIIRFNKGPFAPEIEGDIQRLWKRGFIRTSHRNKAFQLLPEGRNFLEDAQTILTKNKEIVPIIDDKIDYVMEFAILENLLDIIYQMPNPLKPEITIKETELTDYLLSRETKPQNMKPFKMTEIEAESLEISLDPKMWAAYQKAEESVRTQPTIPWRESSLFS